ncbi:hypothetical protein KUTeg_007548 [Tegillarca granosa]|uniref:Uncharacterized protein n=1 Tax=Tegillarca granosa TaxID=220873 RepID=A0ABQ9FDJ8_TEGGR|nr:hypothetical protein KUTeg_007548 [Tegillarca granosa]
MALNSRSFGVLWSNTAVYTAQSTNLSEEVYQFAYLSENVAVYVLCSFMFSTDIYRFLSVTYNTEERMQYITNKARIKKCLTDNN